MHVNQTSSLSPENLDVVFQEITSIKMQQMALTQQINTIQAQNQVLWSQNQALQVQYDVQKETVDKMIAFLTQVYSKRQGKKKNVGGSGSGAGEGVVAGVCREGVV